ncbi:WD40 repeat-like protein [Massarina eburnea CBS 473.64]|uniref:WD40 repeat-like protein n=1 Tax=Massarina eburnea CBS 473.64 TaxID=1395130 RepID=A0A6A6S537_9PLEO|nr:WD40 repeat-like protein [Massarina eburnea CBS 473.64]
MNLAITEDGKSVTVTDKSNNFTSWTILSGVLDRSLNWSEKMPFPDEVGFRRPPLTAALSPDSSLIAIVYRDRPICLYDLDEDMPHGLVSREGDPNAQGLGSMTSPSSLVFNTRKDSHTLTAAYEDGDLCLFDYEDLLLLKTIKEANAHIVACSPDGSTLATGNSNGMVQLLEFDTLQLLYRMNAAEYGIRDLCFSTDNLRFMDVQGT